MTRICLKLIHNALRFSVKFYRKNLRDVKQSIFRLISQVIAHKLTCRPREHTLSYATRYKIILANITVKMYSQEW